MALPAGNLLPAIGHAHRLMDSAAVSRRAVLAAEVSGGFEPRQRRAVPPKVLAPRQKARAALAERVWSAVASGDRRTLDRAVHPDSPAAALVRVYGPAAFTGIIGMPAGELPQRFTTAVDAEIVHGTLLGSSGTEYHYFIPARTGRRPRCCRSR